MLREGWFGLTRLRFVAGILLVMGIAGCAATPEPVPTTGKEMVEATAVAPQPQVHVAEVAKPPVEVSPSLSAAGKSCPCCKKSCVAADMKDGQCAKCAKCAKSDRKCDLRAKKAQSCDKKRDACAKMNSGKKSCKPGAMAGKGCDKCPTKCDHEAMKDGCCAKCGTDVQSGKKCELPAMMPGMMDHQHH